MKKQISRISVHQTSKVMSFIYFVLSAIICIPFGIFGLVSTGDMQSLFMLVVPVFYLLFGYVMMALCLWIYNLIAASFGGIEFILQEVEE
jgi:hypothetical protein